jgi:LPS-assembly lipoprotein
LSLNPRLFATLPFLALAACGFSPLYGGGGGGAGNTVASRLDTVNVQNIPDRPGQELREALETQLHAAGAPTVQAYSLNITYSITTAGIGVLEDTATTRNRFTAVAQWTLTPIGAPEAPLTQGTATTQDAANIVDQQYFALNLETNTINQHLADELAAQITSQLATWFKTHPDS